MKIFKGRFLTIPEMAVYRDRTILNLDASLLHVTI